ncbi:MAG: tetratricopeptide repeat protein [Polyangiaceae bacterium]
MDPNAPPPQTAPAKPPLFRRMRDGLYEFFGVDLPTFSAASFPLCVLSLVLFARHLRSNFIFDEQEALLANPYVRSVADAAPKYLWRDAFKLDFWGRTVEGTIGSYRPLPNLVWRLMWLISAKLRKLAPGGGNDSPLLCHWVNLIGHGLNGALVTALAFQLSRRRDVAWLSGAAFTACAVLTEAVSGVVGLSDVMGTMGALFALLAVTLPLPHMIMGVFLGTTFGLYSKESALCCVPLVPVFALLVSQRFHPNAPRRILRAFSSFVAAAGAFVLYVQVRRKLFPVSPPTDLLPEAVAHKGRIAKIAAGFLRWYAQPAIPRDALNNPLIDAPMPLRIAGALRVYARGLGQVLFPWTLSGDYSAPQEPAPTKVVFAESIIGAICMFGPVLLFPFVAIRSYRKFRMGVRAGVPPHVLAARDPWPLLLALWLWVSLSFFPVSNIPILLPTIRAERFWYFPAIGTSILLGYFFAKCLDLTARYRRRGSAVLVAIVCFLGFQAFAARRHANHYSDDLVFWESTQRAVPNSAKAHLNYSVMLGSRGRMEERKRANERAIELQPKWAMANVYLGDTLCRMHRPDEAIPHYKVGFNLGPNDVSLLALGLQCLWDEKVLRPDSNLMEELTAAAAEHNGSWYDWLIRDLAENGEKNNGVDPKHRPRGYNEGPKDK